MTFPRHQLYIAGLWCFWVGPLCFWFAFRTDFLKWIVLLLAILFAMVTVSIVSIARYRQSGHHPLFDVPVAEPPPGLPTKKRTEWKRWQDVYQFICPLVRKGLSWEQIKAQLETQSMYPNSVETIRKIYQAGQAGFLETWPPNLA